MARKQMTIAGMGRQQHPAVEEAAEEYRIARDERATKTRVEVQTKQKLIAIMQAQKIGKYIFDGEDGEELLVELLEVEKVDVKVSKTGEKPEPVAVTEQVQPHDDPSIPRGLIAQAMKAQEEAGVSESADGDVTVPDKAAPKKPRRGKKSS